MAGKNVEGQLELFSLFDSVEELEQKIQRRRTERSAGRTGDGTVLQAS